MPTRVHLDTDFGGDPDDACALAMLLGWPDVELVGITTTIDPDGMRAAQVAHCLDLAGRSGIPLAAGAAVSLSTLKRADPVVGDARYWPRDLAPRPSRPGAALDLLLGSIEAGATVIGIGPATNLGLLEVTRPGSLARVPVAIMGGWVRPPAAGFPAWGAEMDFNVQWDIRAAEIVAAAAGPDFLLGTLSATIGAHLRARDLPRLRAAGPLGALLARQSEAYAADQDLAALGRAHPALPDDLLNVHWDPVTAAAALGWPGATIEAMTLRPVRDGEILRFEPDPAGRPTRIVTAVDGDAFAGVWLAAMEAAQQTGRS